MIFTAKRKNQMNNTVAVADYGVIALFFAVMIGVFVGMAIVFA